MTLAELVYAAFDEVQEKDGGEVSVCCCFCQQVVGEADTKFRLGINVETGVAHCFKCDTSSGDRNSIVNSKRRTFNRLCEALGYPGTFTIEEEDIDKKSKPKEDKQKQEVRLPKEFEPLWRDVDDAIGKKALKYLLDRGLTLAQIKKFGLGFCAVGYYGGRIVVPVYYGTKLEGIVGRDFTGNAKIKYLNSEGIKILYNLPKKKDRQKVCLLVEGVFDVWSCDRAKLSCDIIGGLGSKLTPRQLKMLSTYNRVCIWTEPDRAGVEGTIKRARQLHGKKIQTYVILPESDADSDTDPGAMYPEEIKERLQSSKKFSAGIAQLMRTRIAFSTSPKRKKQDKWPRHMNV